MKTNDDTLVNWLISHGPKCFEVRASPDAHESEVRYIAAKGLDVIPSLYGESRQVSRGRIYRGKVVKVV